MAKASKRSRRDQFRCIPNFLPDYPYQKDPEYLRLSEGLNGRQIEFAKAVLLHESNTAALLAVAPHLRKSSAESMVSKYRDDERICALSDWFREILAGEGRSSLESLMNTHQPVTMDEMLVDMEQDYRGTRDPILRQKLRDQIIEFRGLTKASSTVQLVSSGELISLLDACRDVVMTEEAQGVA